ncbi:hypothetical protein PHYBOEH_008934 [Phytophthora boehmeriae]|uniref:Uncharacterized protein n=1 Tax=Phytophthora boehmeriae TaxID=109152 RepID=A0A8T1X7C4_9STRA|nr:hypothetical protein PHYBOEH_008934 [Phytophthora boehmeriae]
MDLKALWAREKARFAAEVNDAPKDSRRRGSVKEDARAKPSAVSAPSPTVKISPAPKKKSSGAINVSAAFGRERERVFQLLLETSATPSMTNAAPNFSGANEFAVEYADRAARRLFGGPPPSQQQPPAASTVQNITSPVVASPTTRGPTGRKSSLHVSSMASLHGQSSSTQVQSTQSSGQPTTFSTVTKTAQNTRKNGRKRVGTEFSSHALKPYSGDIFGTRGDYIDGMLYMSRMKRSYQAMYSGGDQQGRNADPNLPWAELARPEGRSVLKDGVMDAFAVAGGINASSNGGKMSVSGDRRRRYGSTIVISAANDDDDGQGSSMPIMQWKQQQRCSLTLSNWSFNPENARLMVQENVVEALIRLCKDGDETTILNCVTAFMNLSHLYELRRVIVQQEKKKKNYCKYVPVRYTMCHAARTRDQNRWSVMP